jgi:hypothetical protein
MKKTLYSCGNSYSDGSHLLSKENGEHVIGRHVSYSKIVADELGMNFVQLARSGASNYFTCKQIEYAIEQKADLILINFTSTRHLDFVFSNKKLKMLPKLSNFIYDEPAWCKNIHNPSKNEIDEELIHSLKFTILDLYRNSKEHPEFETLIKYLDEHNDYMLRMDQERMMILGVMSQLEKSGIKYIVTDFWGISFDLSTIASPKNLADLNILNYVTVDPLVSFPTDFSKTYPNEVDKFHFNQEGNQVAAERILPIARKLLEG